MADQFDVPLTDLELMGEVELLAALITAANQYDVPLSGAEVDAALGLG